jgi:hypothetical protein
VAPARRRLCSIEAQAIPGAGLDKQIGQLLIDTLTPLTIEAALTVTAELEHRAAEADALRAAALRIPDGAGTYQGIRATTEQHRRS